MPIIAILNSKGGTGKSTTALVLGTTLARHGATVTAFDCDRNQNLMAWKDGPTRSQLEVVAHGDEHSIGRALKREAERQQFVIADLEGAASLMSASAVLAADLVVVPTRGSMMDATQARRALSMIEDQAALGAPRRCRVLFTCTKPGFATRDERAIREKLGTSGATIMRTDLAERAAYRSMFTYRLAPEELDPQQVNGLDKALENADALANEVVQCVTAPRLAA